MDKFDTVVNIFHRAYEENSRGKDFTPTDYEDTCKKFTKTLTPEQYELFHEYDLATIDLQINLEKSAIKYLVSLMFPEE